jgi:hypothetical protein
MKQPRSLSQAFAAFAAIAGLTGVVITLLTAPSVMRLIATLLLFSVAAGLSFWIGVPELLRLYRAARSLPSASELDSVSRSYRIEQATADQLGWIAQLEASIYTGQDAIPEYLIREWFAANPTGFSIIKNPEGKPIGHLDILPIRPGTLEGFLGGAIVERGIRGDSLYSTRERRSIKQLYIESIILCAPKARSNAAAILAVFSELPSVIRRIANPRSVEAVYAIAATRAGEALLRRLGFELLRPGELRNDRHSLFTARPSVILSNALKLSGRRSK